MIVSKIWRVMRFEQVVKLTQRCRIGCGAPGRVNSYEIPNRSATVDPILDTFVEQPEAPLGNVHPQHARDADRSAARS